MSNPPDIYCKDLKVVFPLFDSVSRSVKARISGSQSGIIRSFTALDTIDLSIENGERVGLLGKNGAGKSTLLRTFAGVYAPQSGVLKINGLTTSLYEAGVGTDPNASGYENVPLLMAARGISRSKLEEVIADIEMFTELGEALFRPLRTYSAGMKLRIAFAVATYHCEGILLMDEVMGVGDAQFKEKARLRMMSTMERANTLVLASHATSLLKSHCNRGVVLCSGKKLFDGPIDEAIKFHNLA